MRYNLFFYVNGEELYIWSAYSIASLISIAYKEYLTIKNKYNVDTIKVEIKRTSDGVTTYKMIL